ncbi:MAG: hypothetical protein DU429_02755 [Candidatus Tokpelaia sp.]|nr:MAG: hypothetical protein DU430_05505 [Candidatus Tokpelaia sp.]KAA6207392.1 MAG: hypothetical protein DU429_02755 [Candidatus Tokpelaia sp.]
MPMYAIGQSGIQAGETGPTRETLTAGRAQQNPARKHKTRLCRQAGQKAGGKPAPYSKLNKFAFFHQTA